MSSIVEADVPALFIKAALEADATLMGLTVTVEGQQRTIQGIHFMAIASVTENDYPCVVINAPYLLQSPTRMIPNGPNLVGASFGVDVMLQARDVEPNDAGLLAMRARIRALLEGKSGPVVGGAATSIWIEGFPPPQRIDRGYIFTQIGVTFGVGSQVN